MFRDEFKERYSTIPLAIYRAYCDHRVKEVISHQHKEIELISITEGSADFYINGQLYKAQKGDILIIPPYAIHRANISANTITSYYCICFNLQLLCDEELRNGLECNTLSAENLIRKEKPYAASIADYIENAFLACDRNETGWELETMGNISLLFSVLKKNFCFTENLQDKDEQQFARAIMSYINNHFSEMITSRTAADALYMNQSYFCRLFKKTFGSCFAEYITAYRLEKAKIYLTNTKMSVSQVSFQTGFNSCSYFGKTFKEKYGVSPLSYRKNHNS